MFALPMTLVIVPTSPVASNPVGKTFASAITVTVPTEPVACKPVTGTLASATTATEPTLEAWDDSNHTTADKHVLGGETGYDSFVNAICTTSLSPGTDWIGSESGTKIAGSVTLGLNDGDPITMTGIATGETYDCYANIGILIPASYATPGAETFVTTIRYTYM